MSHPESGKLKHRTVMVCQGKVRDRKPIPPERRLCLGCLNHIGAERLKALPGAKLCVGCSDEEPLTNRDVEMDGPDNRENLKVIMGR